MADHEAEQDRRVNDLLRTVVEQDGNASRINKARYMLETARLVLNSEVPALAGNPQKAGERQTVVNLGLEHFVHHPAPFLESLANPIRPEQQDVDHIARLLSIPTIAQAHYMQQLPAPAAMAAIGVLNALGYIDRLQRDVPDHPETPKVIPYYLSVAAAWNHVGKLLAGTAPAPDKPDAQARDPAQPWPPPWLDFLQDLELNSRNPYATDTQAVARNRQPSPGRLPPSNKTNGSSHIWSNQPAKSSYSGMTPTYPRTMPATTPTRSFRFGTKSPRSRKPLQNEIRIPLTQPGRCRLLSVVFHSS